MKKLVAALVAVAALAPVALASASGTIKVSRKTVNVVAGNGGVHLRVSGQVTSGCPVGQKGLATVYSNAFDRHAAKQRVGGIPGFNAGLDKNCKFSVRVLTRASQNVTSRTYIVAGRYKGGKFASTKLKLNYQAYP